MLMGCWTHMLPTKWRYLWKKEENATWWSLLWKWSRGRCGGTKSHQVAARWASNARRGRKKKKSHWCSTHNRIGAGAANWKTRYINVSMYTKSLSCPHYRATKKKKERQSGRPALSLKHFSNSNSSFSPTNCVEAYSYIVLPWLSLFAETSAALILFVLALNAQHYTLETHPFTL